MKQLVGSVVLSGQKKGVRTTGSGAWLTAVVAVTLLGASACGKASDANQKPVEAPAAMVEATPVLRRTIERRLAVTGALLPYAETTVSAEVSGRLTELHFDIQQVVSKGTVLARVDDTEYQLQFAQAKAAMAQARLSAERAEQEFARDSELLGTGSISQRAIDVSRTSRDASQAQLAASAAAVNLAEKRLQDAAVRAPIAGAVTSRTANIGDYVRSPQAIAKIVQMNPLKIQVVVPERFAGVVEAGQKIELIVDAYPGQFFEGRVARLNPAMDPATRTFIVEGTVPNPDGRLKPGFFAKAAIITGVTEQALVVPADALIKVDDKAMVYVSHNGKASLTPVETGDSENRLVEIIRGVSEGDSVLINGHTTLTDGARITVAKK